MQSYIPFSHEKISPYSPFSKGGFSSLIILFIMLVITGCSSVSNNGMLWSQENSYLKSKAEPMLVVPPDLNTQRISDVYTIPPVQGEVKKSPPITPPISQPKASK